MAALLELFSHLQLQVPVALSDWDDRVDVWLREYGDSWPDAYITETLVDASVFLFDHTVERVVLAYAVSSVPATVRDANRIRGYPNVNQTVRAALGPAYFKVDTGHFLGHAGGGRLDINLFPHRRELNRGWSSQGRAFRRMEDCAASSPGTFFYHRPQYDDDTCIPAKLEYGVLVDGVEWSIDLFDNKGGDPGRPPS